MTDQQFYLALALGVVIWLILDTARRWSRMSADYRRDSVATAVNHRLLEEKQRVARLIEHAQATSDIKIKEARSLAEIEVGKHKAMQPDPSNLTVAEAYRIFGEAEDYRARWERAVPWMQRVVDLLDTVDTTWVKMGANHTAFVEALSQVLDQRDEGRSLLASSIKETDHVAK